MNCWFILIYLLILFIYIIYSVFVVWAADVGGAPAECGLPGALRAHGGVLSRVRPVHVHRRHSGQGMPGVKHRDGRREEGSSRAHRRGGVGDIVFGTAVLHERDQQRGPLLPLPDSAALRGHWRGRHPLCHGAIVCSLARAPHHCTGRPNDG